MEFLFFVGLCGVAFVLFVMAGEVLDMGKALVRIADGLVEMRKALLLIAERLAAREEPEPPRQRQMECVRYIAEDGRQMAEQKTHFRRHFQVGDLLQVGESTYQVASVGSVPDAQVVTLRPMENEPIAAEDAEQPHEKIR